MNIKGHPLVQHYLEEISKDIRDPHVKEEICAEILGHIEDKLHDQVGAHTPSFQDIENVLLAMDKAVHFHKGLIQVHQPVRSLFARYIGYVVLICFICAAFYTEWVFRDAQQKITEMEKKKSSHLEEFLNDIHVLQGQKFISEIGSARDAGHFLNEKIPYEDSGRIIQNYKAEIIQHEDDKYVTVGKEFSLSRGALPVKNLWKQYDLSWMSQLHQYDHWDYTTSGPLYKALDESVISVYQFPLPSYTQLQFMARLRLAQGLDEKKPLQAFKDVHKFSQLIYSNETLVAGMIALSILKDERIAYEYAIQKNLLSEKDYTVIPLVEIERMRRVTWAAAAFTYYLVDRNVMSRVLAEAGQSSVICSGVAEGFTGNLHMRKFFEDSKFIERDFTENQKNMQTLLEQTPQCRLGYLRSLWADPSKIEKHETAITKDSPLSLEYLIWVLGAYVPYVRHAIGLQYYVIAQPSMMRLYEKVD